MPGQSSAIVGSPADAAVPSPDANNEESVTLRELVEEEESLQADAAAVLGASDEKNCSYPHGYVDRQALYACSTCTPPDKDPAGVCLACSYACHEGHELYELYTKRNFRCDCGNERFGNFKCSLFSAKSASNAENLYNQNFAGIYCRCARPYPDPEQTGDPEEMLQCVVCEDWFHLNHIGLKDIATDTFDELICDECMKAHPFLWKYNVNIESLEQTADESSLRVDVETEPPAAKKPRSDDNDNTQTAATAAAAAAATAAATSPLGKVSSSSQCILSSLSELEELPSSGAVWPTSWRRLLCSCDCCKQLYSSKRLSFLPCSEDTTRAYQKKGETKLKETPDPLMKALNGLGHVQKIEVIDGYNNLKSCLSAFLRKRAEANAVVTEEDIQTFFKGMKEMQSKKNAAIPGFFCR